MTFRVYGRKYNSGEPDDLNFEDGGDPSVGTQAHVVVVTPHLTIPLIGVAQFVGNAPIDSTITVTVTDPTNGDAPIPDFELTLLLTNNQANTPLIAPLFSDHIRTGENGTANVHFHALMDRHPICNAHCLR